MELQGHHSGRSRNGRGAPESSAPCGDGEAGITARSTVPFAVGHGYDTHRLAPGRKLVLGGVEIAHEYGLEGHSDADVVLHAVMDALLGAAGFDDIGHYFPNWDERWRDASSLAMLSEVSRVVLGGGWQIGNIDATVIAEAPRLSPFVSTMKDRIAECLEIESSRVGLKATTAEGSGPEGRGESMSAFAVALLFRQV